MVTICGVVLTGTTPCNTNDDAQTMTSVAATARALLKNQAIVFKLKEKIFAAQKLGAPTV